MIADFRQMIKAILDENMPQAQVKAALAGHPFGERVYVVAIGKAAWTMAQAAGEVLGSKLAEGIVITKYSHSQGPLPRFRIFEGGHPVIDENCIAATAQCIDLVGRMADDGEMLLLISGGGSALFEKPAAGVTLRDLAQLTEQMLASGADIVEINMVRKRLSTVKAGRFAQMAAPRPIFAVILSDVLGDRLDSIASGPAAADLSTSDDAHRIVEKYNLQLSTHMRGLLAIETPKRIDNVKTAIIGSVRTLCESAARAARGLGYTPHLLSAGINGEASQVGKMLAAIAQDTARDANCFTRPCAIIAGGETVVTLRGSGRGGRNQELALAAAKGIAGLANTLVFSLGSDGTDGPTDAAGGVVDGQTAARLAAAGLDIDAILANNDAYNGLKAVDGLIITGPTGTNVNDVAVVLCS